MKTFPKILSIVLIALILLGATACADYDSAQPTASPYATYYSTLTPVPSTMTVTPSILNMPTSTPESGPLPACNITTLEGKLLVLDDNIIFSIGPDEDVLDKALADNFPEWATFEQTFSSGGVSVNESAGRVVRTASFQEQFALNSAVNLITIGVNSGWQLPADGDLYSDALSTGEKLVGLWHDWNLNKNNIQGDYPKISNASTYALFIRLYAG